MEFKKLTPEIAADWDQVVYHSDDGWAFHLSAWLEAMASVWRRPCYSFAAIENRRMVAVMPVGFNPDTNTLSSGGWTEGGPVIRREVSPTDRARLWRLLVERGLELARELQAQTFAISLSPVSRTSLNNRWGVNPLLEHGFTDLSAQTWIVDLGKTEEELWAGLATNSCRGIKKARSLGYSVAKRRWADVFDSFYTTHRVTYERNNLTPHVEKNFRPLVESFEPAGHSHIWECLDPQGRPVGYHTATTFQDAGFYHAGCSLTDRLDDGVNPLLFWTAMTDLKGLGCRWYDFGPAHPLGTGKNKQLSDFKRKFGSEMHRSFKGEVLLSADEKANVLPAPAPPTFPAKLRSFLLTLPSRLYRKSS